MTTKRRQSHLMTREQLEDERKERIREKQTRYDTAKLAVVYGRQSTKDQPIRNKEAALMQSEGLYTFAVEDYKWPVDRIKMFMENELDKYGQTLPAGKRRSASGRLDIIFRPGLREVEKLIESGQVGAVFVRDVSRLFRDEDMINPPRFAKLCKQYHVVIITYDAEYDFNATAREDLKDFLEEAQAAADYLRWQRRTMLRAKDRKGLRGDYAGNPLPTGFMLDDRRKEYIPNPYWSPVVAQLTRRYRELDGDITTLYGEIRGKAIFPELPDEIKARVGHIYLRPVPGGYTIATQRSLIAILINPANIGHRVYKRRIVKWGAHAAIVNLEEYTFALQRLGTVDLEGNPIDHTPRTKRYTQQGTRREGLLAGIRSDGRPTVCSSQGNVYVLQANTHPALYVIKEPHSLETNPFNGSITVSSLDAVISERIEEKLHTLLRHAESDETLDIVPLNGGSPLLNDMLGKVQAMHQEEKRQSRAMLDHVAQLRQQVTSDLQKIQETITDIEKSIARKTRDYDVAHDVMSDADIREHFASLARLRARLADLQEKQEQIAQGDAEIVTAMSRLERARQEWGSMSTEQKRACVRLMTQSITLDRIADRWTKLTIEWNPILADMGFLDYAIILQGNGAGSTWTQEEDAILQAMYPTRDRVEILCALPKRTWVSVKTRATRLHCKRRFHEVNDGIMGDTICIEDMTVMQAYSIPQADVEAGVRVWLGVMKADSNSGSTMKCST